MKSRIGTKTGWLFAQVVVLSFVFGLNSYADTSGSSVGDNMNGGIWDTERDTEQGSVGAPAVIDSVNIYQNDINGAGLPFPGYPGDKPPSVQFYQSDWE